MDTIHISCPECGKRLRASAEHAGKTAVCPGCGGKVRVPALAEAERPPWESKDLRRQANDPRSGVGEPEAFAPQSEELRAGDVGGVRWKRMAAVAVGAACLVCAAIVAWHFIGTDAQKGGDWHDPDAAIEYAEAQREEEATADPLEEAVRRAEQFQAEPKAEPKPKGKPDVFDEIIAMGEEERPEARELSADALFKRASPAVVRVEVRDRELKSQTQGSGFFVSEDGLIVTNYHVIEGAHYATVRLEDGSVAFVEGLAGVDRRADLALLKVKAAGASFLELGQLGLPSVGTRVYAIGNPQGLTNTLSEGLVSGHRKVEEGMTLIQTTAAISPGSSGGPLLAADGRVVGVTTSFLAEGQNLNFAVPAERVMILVKGRGKIERLASAGGGRLGRSDARRFDRVWDAIDADDYEKALEVLAELAERQRDSKAYWKALGAVQSELGNHELAAAAYMAVLKLSPGNCDAYSFLGDCYEMLEEYENAIAAYSSAVLNCPDDWYAYSGLGGLLQKHGGIREGAVVLCLCKEGVPKGEGRIVDGQGYWHDL